MRRQDVIGWSEETPSPVVDDDDDDIKIRDVKAGSGLVFGLVGTRKRTVLCVYLSLFVIGQFDGKSHSASSKLPNPISIWVSRFPVTPAAAFLSSILTFGVFSVYNKKKWGKEKVFL